MKRQLWDNIHASRRRWAVSLFILSAICVLALGVAGGVGRAASPEVISGGGVQRGDQRGTLPGGVIERGRGDRGEVGAPDSRGDRAGRGDRGDREVRERPDRGDWDHGDWYDRVDRPSYDRRYRYRYRDPYPGYYDSPSLVLIQPGSTVDYPGQEEASRPKPKWVPGHYEEVPMQDVIEGETVEVYHPAVYRRNDDGTLTLIEEARTTEEPKVRIILTKAWTDGHYETPEAEAGSTTTGAAQED